MHDTDLFETIISFCYSGVKFILPKIAQTATTDMELIIEVEKVDSVIFLTEVCTMFLRCVPVEE